MEVMVGEVLDLEIEGVIIITIIMDHPITTEVDMVCYLAMCIIDTQYFIK